MSVIKIVEYQPSYQPGIDRMMERIQQEFDEQISSAQSTKLHEAYLLPKQKYWIALSSEQIAGTIGLVLLADHTAVVKRMMVDPAFRGSEWGTARLLLDQSFAWGKEHGTSTIYLGTMEQFKAAQKFYTKQGFHEIGTQELPSDFTINPIDTIFYKLAL